MTETASKDELGDRMKAYEGVESQRRLDVSLPIYARIDGRGFSKFTRGMKRPFDPAMSEAMIATTAELVKQTHAALGYTQSDEISLIWAPARTEESTTFFDGKVQKLVSVLASLSAAAFDFQLSRVMPERVAQLPHFDCRVFNLPSLDEGANAILWRALDARKNAVQMVAHHHFSHRQLHGQGQAAMLEMMAGINVDFHAFPAAFRHGTFVRRVNERRDLSAQELKRIPLQHRPTGPVMRTEIKAFALEENFVQVVNRVDFVFNGARAIVNLPNEVQ